MSDNWNTVTHNCRKKTVKTKEVKEIKEEIYYLSDLIFNGGCIRCINKTCKIKEQHGIPFPEVICNFIKCPSYINGIKKSIDDAKLDFNDKKPFFTTCNYAFGVCKNCNEGRIKCIEFNNLKIALCYPNLESILHKVTVGMHIDVKLILKGKKYEVYAHPVEINFIDEDEDYMTDIYDEIYDKPIIDEWPSLNNTDSTNNVNNVVNNVVNSVKNEVKILDFSKFKKIKENVIENEFCERVNKQNNIDIPFEKEYKEDILKETQLEDIHYDFEFKRLNTFLMDENEDLKIENENLLNRIFNLEKENKRQMFIIKNSSKYEEIFNNTLILNTRVTEQFLENNYSEYIIY